MMIRRAILVSVVGLLWMILLARAQEGFNLPTELYVLLNSGVVQRYGLGAAGISSVTPDKEFVLDFGVAPDGNWLAYRTQSGLTLANMFIKGSGQQIDSTAAGVPPVRGRGDTLVWSPNGDAIAYTTEKGARVYFNSGTFADIVNTAFVSLDWSWDGRYLAAEADQNIWWIYRREGTQMILTSAIYSSVGITWISPTELLFAPAEGGLISMDLANANHQTVIEDNKLLYRLPYYQPDGTVLVYAKPANDKTVDANAAQLALVTLKDKKVKALGQSVIDLTDVQWSPGGDLLFALHGGTLAMVNRITGEGLTLPVNNAVSYSWGPRYPASDVGIKLPTDGYFLAKDANGIAQVWKLPRDGSPPSPITPAEKDVTEYAVSPNARTLAYFSDGSLWALALNGSGAPTALTPVPGEGVDIVFSPNGQKIAYVILGSADQPQGGIWLIPTAGGDAEQLLINGDKTPPVYQPPFYRDPLFAPNINALLVTVGQSESQTLGMYDLDAHQLLPIAMYDGGSWLGNGRILAYGNGIGIGNPPPSQDLFVINANSLDKPERISGIAAPMRLRAIGETAQGRLRALVSQNLAGPAPLQALDISPSGGDPKPIANLGFLTTPLLSPDGAYVAGYTHPHGALIVRKLPDGAPTMLSQPSEVWGFQWALS
jgi:Tol biopolymer transport system component